MDIWKDLLDVTLDPGPPNHLALDGFSLYLVNLYRTEPTPAELEQQRWEDAWNETMLAIADHIRELLH